ncbi:hypothetical protein N665_3376s0004 [Sinapis alba]|nr:hypothetical protein N665_3376s0004 [Sinapis alba]
MIPLFLSYASGSVTSLSTRDSWKTFQAFQITIFHLGDSRSKCCASLTKSRIYSSPPCTLGSSPTLLVPPPYPTCFLPRVSVVTAPCSNLAAADAATTNASSQTYAWLTHHRSGSTRSVFRGVPLPIHTRFTYIHQPYRTPSSSLAMLSGLTLECPLHLRKSNSFRHAPPPHVTSTPVDRSSAPATLFSPILKIFGRFTVIFTETYLHTMPHLSFAKKSPNFQLLVDSPGSSSLPSFASFSLENRSALPPASFSRSVFPPNVKWRCLSISIIVCLSCGAVCLGPEDATDFVSTIIRGADWISTSHFKVTIFQVSGIAENLVSTHSSFSLNSLSPFRRGFSISIVYVVSSFVGRDGFTSLFNCSPNS